MSRSESTLEQCVKRKKSTYIGTEVGFAEGLGVGSLLFDGRSWRNRKFCMK